MDRPDSFVRITASSRRLSIDSNMLLLCDFAVSKEIQQRR
jgi:hypothetical protein